MYYQQFIKQTSGALVSAALTLMAHTGSAHETKSFLQQALVKTESTLTALYETVLEGLHIGAVTKADVISGLRVADFEAEILKLAALETRETPEPETNWMEAGNFISPKAVQALASAVNFEVAYELPENEDFVVVRTIDFDASVLEHFVAQHAGAFAEAADLIAAPSVDVLAKLKKEFASSVVMNMSLPSLDIYSDSKSGTIDQIAEASEISGVSLLILKKDAQFDAVKRAFTKEMLAIKFTQLAKEDSLMIFGMADKQEQDLVYILMDFESQVFLVEVTGKIQINQE